MDYTKTVIRANRALIYLFLVVTTFGVTWGTMTIMALREENAQLEERLDELKVTNTILDANATLLQEEKEALENHPLK